MKRTSPKDWRGRHSLASCTTTSIDTWTIEALREIDVAEETQQRERPQRARRFIPPPAADVTADVDHILKRIADLESELTAAKALNVDVQSARFDEHVQSEKAREELQQQIAQKAVQLATLQENHATLREELAQSIELAAQRGAAVKELKALLVEEETSAEQLALQLASKLREGDGFNSTLAARSQTIGELRATLDAAATGVTELQRELSATRASLSDERDSLLSLHDVVAEKAAALASTEQQLVEARQSIDTLQGEIAAQLDSMRNREMEQVAAQAEVAALRRERDETQRSLAESLRASERVKAEANSHLQLLHVRTSELAALQQELNQQAPALHELEQGMQARDELVDQLRRQLQTTQDEHGIMAGQLQKTRLRVKSLAEQIFQRDNQIAALKSDLSVHVEALAAIRRDVSRVDDEPPRTAAGGDPQRVLQPVDHDGEPIVLDRKVITIGRTAENDVCVPSKLISRHHARLVLSPNGVIVEDAGSTNGCFVNGKQVKHQLMRDGDVLELGDLRYCLYTPSPNDTRVRDYIVPFAGK